MFIFIGVESFDIDLKEQKVTVKGNVQPDEVLQAVSKSGKKTAFWVDEAQPPENKPSETAPVTFFMFLPRRDPIGKSLFSAYLGL